MNWNPTEEEEILQNVASIIAMPRGNQSLFRALGIQGLLDYPANVGKAKVAAAVATQIKTYEPRADVASITVTGSADGSALVPTVRLR